MSKLLEILERPVDVRALVDSLEFGEDDFEAAALNQAPKYFEASRYLVLKIRRRMRLLLKHEVLQAQKKLSARGRKRGSGRGERVTEGAISDAIHVDREVRLSRVGVDGAYISEEFAKRLLDAYKQRQSMIKVISDLRASEMASEIRHVKEKMLTGEMKKRAKAVRRQYRDIGEEEDD